MKDSNGRVDFIIRNAQNINDNPIFNKITTFFAPLNEPKEFPGLNVEFALEFAANKAKEGEMIKK